MMEAGDMKTVYNKTTKSLYLLLQARFMTYSTRPSLSP